MYLQYVWWKYATLLFVFYFSHLFFVLFFIFSALFWIESSLSTTLFVSQIFLCPFCDGCYTFYFCICCKLHSTLSLFLLSCFKVTFPFWKRLSALAHLVYILYLRNHSLALSVVQYLKPSVLLSSFLVVCGGRVNLDPDALSWPEANILRTNSDKETAVGEGRPKNRDTADLTGGSRR